MTLLIYTLSLHDALPICEDIFAFLLGNASQHCKVLAFALQPLVFVQAVEDFLFGLIANRAGVVQDQPCVGLILDAHVAFVLERPDDLLGVMGVHLAAKRLDVKGLRHIPSISLRRNRTHAVLMVTAHAVHKPLDFYVPHMWLRKENAVVKVNDNSRFVPDRAALRAPYPDGLL